MIQDILRSKIGTFIVDNTVNSVPVIPSVFPNQKFESVIAHSTSTDYFIAQQDNVILETVSVVLPYAFVSAFPLQMSIGGCDSILHHFLLAPYLGGASSFWFHSENVEIQRDLYLPFTISNLGNKYLFEGFCPALENEVCCLNAPASLNGVELPVYAFIKIKHTIPMVL
jgi:hypothetical protein